MKPIRIFQHHDWTGPGYLHKTLSRRNIPFEIVAIHHNEPVKQSLTNVSALVFLGSEHSVNDSLPWIADELKLVQSAVEKNVPILGHCFGAQLISKALGGRVTEMPQAEIGWHQMKISDTDEAHQWLPHSAQDTPVIVWHHNALSIPDNTLPLMGTDYYPAQAFVHGNILATVAHFEATPAMVQSWVDRYAKDLQSPSEVTQAAADILHNIEKKAQNMHKVTNILYAKWLTHLAEHE